MSQDENPVYFSSSMQPTQRIWRGIGVSVLAFSITAGGLFLFSNNRHDQVHAQDVVATFPPDSSTKADQVFHDKVTPLLKTYCYQCHGDGLDTGGLALDSFTSAASVTDDSKTWDKLLRYVRTHQMPPSTEAQPTDAERKIITDWVDGQLNRYYTEHPDPGRVTIHRLNKSEYNNSIRDLLGLDIHPADDFPMDDSGYGFDNIADVLSLPPMLMEKYVASATKVLDEAIATEAVKSRVDRTPASLAEVAFYSFGDRGDGWVRLNSGNNGYCAVDVDVPSAGEYIMRIQAFSRKDGDPGINGGSVGVGIQGNGPMTASLQLENTIVRNVAIVEDESHPQVYEAHVVAPPGKHRFQVVIHHYRGGADEDIISNAHIGRDQPGPIFIKYIEIEGPLPYACGIYSPAKLISRGLGQNLPDGSRTLFSAGDVSVSIELKQQGNVILRVTAVATRCGDEPAQLELRADGKPIKQFDVLAPAQVIPWAGLGNGRPLPPDERAAIPQTYEITANLPPGKHQLSAAFLNPANDLLNTDPNLVQRTITISSVQVLDESQPPPRPPMPEVVRQLFQKHGADLAAQSGSDDAANDPYSDPKSPAAKQAAQAVISDFAFKAWRRPVPQNQLDRLLHVYDVATDQGETFFGSVKLAMEAVLVSPRFLFRGAYDSTDNSGNQIQSNDEFTLASRLSYFLWSSTPDDELLDLANRGQLRQNLSAQVTRMLASPKAHALVENFGGQWLQFRGLETFEPAKTFTKFDTALQAAIKKEPELLFDYVMRQDRSIVDFIDADYTFANQRLAEFYGISGVTGDDFQKVSLAGTPRRGILTEAGILLLTSNPTRTSPVKRGKWVLENVLGAPPPPPPPNVPPLDDSRHQLTGTLRQQMEQHRALPLCASCHAIMDPIGFGLENFDAIGDFRTVDANQLKIDSTGTLITGESFAGALELSKVLSTSRREDFLNCFSEKMLTYALGRGVEYYDRAALDQISGQLDKGEDRFSSLIQAIVTSTPFQMQRSQTASATAK